MSEPITHTGLSQSIRDQLDTWLQRYPDDQKRSGVFEALRLVQEENQGSLTVPLMNAVADYLGMSHVAVYEIATFYTMYHLDAVGRHVIYVCSNISCMLNGADAMIEHIKHRLNINLNETTPDGFFTLKEVECLGACVAPPVCQIGKQYYEHLTPDKMDGILSDLRDKG